MLYKVILGASAVAATCYDEYDPETEITCECNANCQDCRGSETYGDVGLSPDSCITCGEGFTFDSYGGSTEVGAYGICVEDAGPTLESGVSCAAAIEADSDGYWIEE